MKYLFLLSTVVHSVACRTKIDTVETTIVEEDIITLSLSLDQNSAIAGEQIGYSVGISNQHGDILEAESWSIASSIEDDLFWNATSFQSFVAGEHVLLLTATYNGVEYRLEQVFPILPAEIDRVDLLIEEYTSVAGGEIPFSTQAFDQFDNPILDTEIDVDADDPNLLFTADSVTSIYAGLYTVRASVGSIQDIEHVEILPDSASSIQLLVPEENLELYDSINCDVVVEDQYGNLTDDPWSLWVEGTGQTTVSYDIVTFWDEGSYTIFAEIDNTE